MKQIFLVITFLMVGILASAQLEEINSLYQDFQQIKMRNWDEDKDNFNGSPYLDDDFRVGDIVLKGNFRSNKNVPIRYNVFDDELEYKNGDQVAALVKDTAMVESFTLKNRLFILTATDNKSKVNFVEQLYVGNYSLYRKLNVSFTEAKEPKGYQDPTPPTFKVESPSYYLKYDGSYMKVKNIKDIAKKLTDYSTPLSKYIKSEKLKMKRDDDLMKFMEYLNSL